jgi:hypothetical protein
VKKISAFILMICLFFTVMGYHFIFRMRISEAKKEMKARLLAQDSPELIQFDLTPEKVSSLEWEDEKEFLLNGQMFDVVEMNSLQGVVILKCIPDHKETALIEQYLKTNQGNSTEKGPWLALLEMAGAQFLSPTIVYPLPSELCINKTFCNFSENIFSTAFPILTPPPRVC